jgi:hypothetical protein
MTDALDRLAEADPAHELDPAPREDLLAQILALSRSSARERPRARARRRFVVPAVFLVVVALTAAALLIDSPEASRPLDLAARAYARTSAPPDQIVYTLVTSTFIRTRASGEEERETGRVEEWHRGAETHRLETYFSQHGTRTALEHVIDADGVMRQISDDGSYRIVRKSDNEDAANVIAKEQAGFVADFRRRYEHGELDPAGDLRFAGRPARRYRISRPAYPEQPQLVPPPDQAYYVDRETGAPLGFTSTARTNTMTDAEPVETTTRIVQTVRAIRRLDPTPENLRKLRTFILPRRRDADGCIRGPVTNASPSDSASKRDCGGTPGAVIDG